MRWPSAKSFRRLLIAALIGAVPLLSMLAASYAQPAPGGISVDRYRRMFPPAPQNLRVVVRDGKATISWDAPPAPPSGHIGYDPVVVAYNVYLVQENLEQRRRLGQTRSTTFRDSETVGPGSRRSYAVTAVQRSGIESGMSAVVGPQMREEN
jgi:fibronectin type 3 domain-containing protein